jgi:hypothetical protein
MPERLLRLLRLLLLVVAVSTVATACSGSDGKGDKGADGKATTTTTSSTSSTTSTTSTTLGLAPDDIDAAASPYCADWQKIRAVAAPKLTGDVAKDDAARKVHYQKLLPTVEKLVADADSDIKPTAQRVLDAVRKVAANGSFAPFNTDESRANQKRLADYALDNCTKK